MKNIRERLNGWQRLWLVFGGIYLAVVIGMTILLIPKALTINDYIGETVEGGEAVPSNKRKYVRIDSKWIQVEAIAHNDKTREFIYFLNGKWSEPVANLEYVKVPRELSNHDVWILRKNQAVFIAIAFICWFVPWLLLYVSGLSIAWIIDGFRKSSRG